ncbi:MAG: hypothetical protein IKS56_09140 [Lachnospiraceae bacterium]|nr:hypothetical protein [Lachnospiraceae bacterium]
MSKLFEDLKTGLEEAIEYEKKLKNNNIYQTEIKEIMPNIKSIKLSYEDNKAQD